ncbi:kinesin-like protein KIF26B isoform X3 [Girardinichthys multiradiatus]|uniref:kinesin-like protein KIF26B isoform X3 n=1 Tax=Girardinichthys multiradiatus TaxID=208333 RepID=UPI001FAD744B|nr:kinesin-like protein KIF26B isoform X3 [Girardinichthys multiradiatus]
MSSVTEREERISAVVRGAHWSPEVQHHCDSGSFSVFSSRRQYQPAERPTPEGSGGPRADPHRNMCQRAGEVPSHKSLPGSLGERIRMSFGSGTTCRGSPSALHPSSGRSDRKVACCEKCSAALVALKKQALSLAVHHHFSCKETSDLSAFLHDNLRVHGHSNVESRDRERELGQCGTCGANLNQLKQEAILLALSRGQSLAKPPFVASLSAGAVLGQSGTKHGDRFSREAVHPPYGQTHSPHSPHSPRSPRTPQRTPQTLRRRGLKLPNPDMDRWVEEQQQLVASKSGSNPDGVTMNSHHQPKADDAIVTCGDAGTVQTTSKIPHISRVVTIANTAAMSLLARAAEKLNLTLRKKGQASDPAPSSRSTCFKEIIQKNPPLVPPCLLQAAARSKDSPDVGKVKVVLRVSRLLSESQGQPPVLQIDPSRKRVTIMEPVTKNLSHSTMTLGRERKSPLKTFSFDAAYSQDSGQAEVCAGVLADVIRCVLSGSDGCVLGLGCADVASWSSMVGSADNLQKLGMIPCAISWLYSSIERRREKTWTNLTVSVSAIELCCGEEDTLRDLLGEVVPSPGSVQDSPKAHIRVTEDPVYGIQLRNHNRVKAPTAERAASLLDAAIAARRHTDFITYLCHSSIMFFTLYVQPPRTESSTIGKGSRGTTKLTMIDVCSGMRGVSKNKLPHSDLGPIVLALLSGHKIIPSKSSKLVMLLRESMPSNCHIAVIGQVADSLAHLQESFSTIQLASRIRRTQKRTKQSTSCSPCGRSLTKNKKGPHSLALRAFHSTEEVDVDFQSLRLRGKLYRSSSDQSCDTVIQINLDGSAHSKAAPLLTQPKFVPIIPSLHPNKSDLDDPEFTALLQELLRIPQLHGEKKTEETVQGDSEGLEAEGKPPERDCLKCDTFAELQERLGCIDGSEVTMEVLKSSLKGATLKNILTKTLPQKETFKAPHTLLNVGKCCSQATVGEKQTDGSLPGDSFKREDSGLFDCEECSANSSSEELMNHALGLSMAYPSVLPTTRAVKSGNNVPSKCFEANSQSKAATNQSEYQLQEKQENHEAADWFKPDKRASPIGNSSPISPSSSCSSSHSMAKTVVIGDHKAKDSKEMKATITVTVQQPLDKMGQDELVFSMVEEVTISGAYDSATTGGNIICIRDPAQSQEHGQTAVSSQPIRIIGDVSDDCSAAASTVVQPASTDQNNKKAAYQFKREIRLLPSFINPMLMNMNLNCELDGVKENESTCAAFKEINSASELKRLNTKGLENNNVDKQSQSCASEIHHLKKSDETCSQICYDQLTSEDKDFCKKTLENKMCEKRLENTHKGHPQACKHAPSTHNQKVPEVVEIACRQDGSNHKTTGVSSGCYETMPGFFATGSLPRSWQKSNHRENPSRAVISSTPCSPGETLERMHGRRQSTENHGLYTSSPQKYIPEVKQDSGKTRKHGKSSSRLRCPADNSSRLFNTKLEQLARRTNSLGRTSRDFPIIERGTSNTSMSSKESSKGSNEASCKASYKENYDGDSTFPRANRSPRRNPRSEHSHHFFHTENPLLQSAKHSHSKLSAVGKLKIATPKVRRQSTPSIKNLSHKALQQSSRSASLSADSKMVSFERTSSFFSSSPPRSYCSISRTPSQSSTCSSTKSAIQGFVNGRLTDLLRERSSSPSSSGPDQMSPLRSPYSQMTAPRTPDHLSGHASDTTSVLSGDLPPAMGKTSLYFSNRSSLVSSGYDSLVRDSEAMGSATSNRDSVSNRSGSLLSVTRSSRSSRRRGNTGTHQRRLSHDTSLPMKQSASGLRSRWTEREIPEAYEIKVYEIDNVQRMHKRAGADKQGLGPFSAKLRFLEHRQQRISEVRVKYNRLRRELEHAKHNLILEPTKWNLEVDLWQTFEVDSLEHLEALEEVTARLENRVNFCKANIMMVTCFDASPRRWRKKRRRKVQAQKTLKQF